MPYAIPDFKQGTIHLPTESLAAVTVYRGAANYLTRSERGQFEAPENTILGESILERGGLYYPYYVWAGDFLVSENDLVLLERYHALLQQDPTIQVTFTDEFFYVDATKATWHNRVIVTDSTKTVNGLSRVICSYNVFPYWTDSDDPFQLIGRSGGREWFQVGVLLKEVI